MTRKNLGIAGVVSLLSIVLLMVSCNQDSPVPTQQPDNYYQAPQAPLAQQSYPSQPSPVIVQSPQSSGFMDGFMGGMLGGMLGNNNSSRHTIERERVVERKTYQSPMSTVRLPTLTPKPTYSPPPSTPSKSLQSFRSGSWGSRRK